MYIANQALYIFPYHMLSSRSNDMHMHLVCHMIM